MTTRSALFVDFDNVYLGLGGGRSAAGRAFAEEPGRWVQWLADGADRSGSGARRFLVKVCYLSESYSGPRRALVSSGFRIVDCPTLTGAGKNSADIHLVIDALDALASDIHYDEFVLASADADFAPLLHRLRSRDRRTTVLTGSTAAPAYTASCDSHVTRERLVRALLGDVEQGSAEAPAVRPAVPVQRGSGRRAQRVSAAVAAVRAVVHGSPCPVRSSTAAQAALNAYPGIADAGWVGGRTFSGFVALHLPELACVGKPTPGYVYDPKRHSDSKLLSDLRG